MSEEDDDKQFEASQRRLDEARKRGEVPRSAELSTAAAYGGLLLGLSLSGVWMLDGVGSAGAVMIGQADRLSHGLAEAPQAPFGGVVAAMGLAVLPIFALPALAALGAILAQRALIFAPEKLELKLSRISPLSTAKQKFGLDGLFDFGKSLIKMLVVGGLLAWFLMRHSADLFLSLELTPAQSTGLMMQTVLGFVFIVTLFSAVIGGLDYFWQRARHLQRNRMSRKEMTDEAKDSEGDPHIKGQRRQRAQEIATNRMLQDVATADVVVVNPTHYAVALKWKRSDRHAPICIAKGVDELAARIRERAAIAGVPLHRDPPTARALHATVGIGEPIRPDHYRAVAAAIRFAEAMRKKGKRR